MWVLPSAHLPEQYLMASEVEDCLLVIFSMGSDISEGSKLCLNDNMGVGISKIICLLSSVLNLLTMTEISQHCTLVIQAYYQQQV